MRSFSLVHKEIILYILEIPVLAAASKFPHVASNHIRLKLQLLLVGYSKFSFFTLLEKQLEKNAVSFVFLLFESWFTMGSLVKVLASQHYPQDFHLQQCTTLFHHIPALFLSQDSSFCVNPISWHFPYHQPIPISELVWGVNMVSPYAWLSLILKTMRPWASLETSSVQHNMAERKAPTLRAVWRLPSWE